MQYMLYNSIEKILVSSVKLILANHTGWFEDIRKSVLWVLEVLLQGSKGFDVPIELRVSFQSSRLEFLHWT
jgi:hypothetical protein